MTVSDETLTLRKSMNMRASLESFAFPHSKTAISFNILLVLMILYLRNMYYSGHKLQSAWYIYHQCSSLLLLMVWRYIYKRQYTDKKTDIEKIYEYASERAWIFFFLHFHILKLLLFPSIFYWYFWCFISETVEAYIFSGLKLQSAWYILYMYHQCVIPTKHWRWENLWICERARSERAWTFLHFHILKLLFPSIFCWYFWYFISETYIFQVCPSQITICMIHISSMQFPVLTYMALYIYTNESIPTNYWLWKKSMYMRVCGASEIRRFSNFYILKLLFLSIFCWYFRYFVGTNDMLVGLHVPTKLRKSIGGGAETSCIFVFGECTTNTGNPRPVINSTCDFINQLTLLFELSAAP